MHIRGVFTLVCCLLTFSVCTYVTQTNAYIYPPFNLLDDFPVPTLAVNQNKTSYYGIRASVIDRAPFYLIEIDGTGENYTEKYQLTNVIGVMRAVTFTRVVFP